MTLKMLLPASALPKAVLDTNVIISGSLWRGPSSRVFDYAREGKLKVCTSPYILDECVRVLHEDKFVRFLQKQGTSPDGLVKAYEKIASTLPDVVLPGVVIRDPNDNIILGCAAAHGAHFIVSGDRHLQDVGSFAGIRILPPLQFLHEVMGEAGEGV